MRWCLNTGHDKGKSRNAPRFGRHLPDVSYTLYVTHFPLMGLGYSLLRPWLDPDP